MRIFDDIIDNYNEPEKHLWQDRERFTSYIRNISTQRLLNLYRQNRFGYLTFQVDVMKAELGRREHIPRKHGRKQNPVKNRSKKLKFKR